MKKICFLLILCAITISLKSMAQTFPVPENYTLKTKEDFPKYEKDVINTINWLEQTPWDVNKEQRKAANTFVMTWITESPTVTLVLNSGILLDITDKNPEMLTIFMGGYLKYALLNKDAKDVYDVNKAYTAGVKAIITKYRSEWHRNKDKNVEMLAKINDSGKLETWVKNDFNTPN
jgi:hypothetical protein